MKRPQVRQASVKGDRNKFSSLEELAYHSLRAMILSGELRPGQQIIQEELAERLQVSRTPLRRAMAQLEKDHFLEMKPHSGAYVRSFTPAEIIGIFEVRAVLEGLVCRLIAPKVKQSHLAYLRALLLEAAEEAERGSDSAYRKADQEFHQYLVGLVDLKVVQDLLPAYQVLSLSFTQGLLRPPHLTLPEHLRILDALEARDQDRAEYEARAHVRNTIEHLTSLEKEK